MIKKVLKRFDFRDSRETVQPVSNFFRHFNRQISHGYIMVKIFNREISEILTVIENLVMVLVN